MTAFGLAAADTDNDADLYKMQQAVLYFVGRIEKASPGFDYGAAIGAEKPFVESNAKAVWERCVAEYKSIATRTGKIGPALEK